VAVGGGVMQLHGGCRFASGASAARAEPLHVLVVSGRAAVPGHGEGGTAKRAGGEGAPSASVKVSSRTERAGGVWRGAVEVAVCYGRCTNMFRRRVIVNGGTSSPIVSTTMMRKRTTTRTMTKTTTTTTATTVTVTRRLRLRLEIAVAVATAATTAAVVAVVAATMTAMMTSGTLISARERP